MQCNINAQLGRHECVLLSTWLGRDFGLTFKSHSEGKTIKLSWDYRDFTTPRALGHIQINAELYEGKEFRQFGLDMSINVNGPKLWV